MAEGRGLNNSILNEKKKILFFGKIKIIRLKNNKKKSLFKCTKHYLLTHLNHRLLYHLKIIIINKYI